MMIRVHIPITHGKASKSRDLSKRVVEAKVLLGASWLARLTRKASPEFREKLYLDI